jgi:hypothetical protein
MLGSSIVSVPGPESSIIGVPASESSIIVEVVPESSNVHEPLVCSSSQQHTDTSDFRRFLSEVFYSILFGFNGFQILINTSIYLPISIIIIY